MPDHIQYEEDDLFNPETHHEHSDVPVRPLWQAMIIFVVFAIVTPIVLWFFYKGLVAAENRGAEAPQTAVARPANAGVPQNQPLLQPFPKIDDAGVELPPYQDTPATDLVEMRRGEESTLNEYGWVDRERGIVRIPIERAKEMYLTRVGLTAAGVTSPGDGETAVTPAVLENQPATGTAPADSRGPAPANVPPAATATNAEVPGGMGQ